MGEIIIRKCPRCGVLFDCYCRSEQKCWCSNYALDKETLRRMSLNFEGCLCPECLKSLAIGSEEIFVEK